MKHLKTIVLIAIFTLSFVGIVTAQKIAYINTDKLLSSMPETKSLQSEMEKLQKTYKNDIEGMLKKLDAKMKKYQVESKTQTQETNQKRAVEIQQERAKIGTAQDTATQEMKNKYSEKLTPILKKAEDAIKAVAAQKGIIYVLDATPGKGLIVYEKGENIYSAVKTKLGF